MWQRIDPIIAFCTAACLWHSVTQLTWSHLKCCLAQAERGLWALHCKHSNHPHPHPRWPTEVSPDPSSVHIRKVFWTNIYSSYITDWMKTLIGCPITRANGQGSGCRATLLNQVEDMDREQCHSFALPANRKEGCNIIFMLWVCRPWLTRPETLNPPHHKEQLTPYNVS